MSVIEERDGPAEVQFRTSRRRKYIFLVLGSLFVLAALIAIVMYVVLPRIVNTPQASNQAESSLQDQTAQDQQDTGQACNSEELPQGVYCSTGQDSEPVEAEWVPELRTGP